MKLTFAKNTNYPHVQLEESDYVAFHIMTLSLREKAKSYIEELNKQLDEEYKKKFDEVESQNKAISDNFNRLFDDKCKQIIEVELPKMNAEFVKTQKNANGLAIEKYNKKSFFYKLFFNCKLPYPIISNNKYLAEDIKEYLDKNNYEYSGSNGLSFISNRERRYGCYGGDSSLCRLYKSHHSRDQIKDMIGYNEKMRYLNFIINTDEDLRLFYSTVPCDIYESVIKFSKV